MSIIKSMFKNTAVFSVGSIFSKIFAFFLIVLIARYLGDAGLGLYSFAFALLEVVGLFSEFGIYTYVVRSVARAPKDMKKILDNYFTLKMVLLVGFTIAINAVILLSPYDPAKKIVIFLASVAYLVLQINNPFFAVYQAKERLEFESLVRTIESVFNFLLVLALLKLGYGIVGVFVGIIFSRTLALLIDFFIFSKMYKRPFISFNFSYWKYLIKISLPFWFTNIFNMLYFYFDTIMLTFLAGTAITGWYNASYKLVAALSFIPITLMYAAFPIMSRLHTENKKALQLMYNRLLKYLLLLIIPIAFGTVMLADRIILYIYQDQFVNSVVALKILILAEVFVFLNQVSIILLNASDKQKQVAITVGICAIVNVVLNLLLIPIYQHKGAAIATVVAQALNFGIVYLIISKHLFRIHIFKKAGLILLASAIMAGILYYFLSSYHLILIILVSGVIYLILAFILNIIDSQDIEFIRKTVTRTKRVARGK